MLEGAQLVIEGLRMLRRERSLWPLAAAPVLLAIAAVLGASVLLYEYASPLNALLTTWLPRLEAGAWYTWIWIGPAKLVLGVVGGLLFAIAAAIAVAVAFLLANVAAAPFLDALSRRVESIVNGAASGEGGFAALWSESWLAIVAELQRVLFFAALTLGISAVGVLVPGAQVVAAPLLIGITAIFLPLQYAAFALDRRRVPFRERRRWLLSRWPLMAAFGGTAFLTFLVPGLNFLMIPALVVGGTLLVLRHPPG